MSLRSTSKLTAPITDRDRNHAVPHGTGRHDAEATHDVGGSRHVASVPTTAPLNDLRVVVGHESLLRDAGLDSLDALFDDDRLARLTGERLDKPGLSPWRSRWRLRLRDSVRGGAQRTVYLKRYDNPPRSARREVERAGRGARSLAGIEWTWGQRLAQDGIPCVEVIALGEDADGRGERRSALLTAEVAGRSLEQWVQAATDRDCSTVRRLLPLLANLVARFHGAGYVHRDLYLAHVFFAIDDLPRSCLRLIDLQRVYQPKRLRTRWIVKDLAALNYSAPPGLVSTADRVRWLRCYLGIDRLDAPARRIIYHVVGKTLRIARHDARRRARRLPRIRER